MKRKKSWVYLLHFGAAYWQAGKAASRPCRHYVGYTSIGVDNRMALHRNGSGSKLVRYALARGIDFVIAGVWDFPSKGEARRFERQIKQTGHYDRKCTVCQESRR